MEKWTRLYGSAAEPPPPWCSGKPSTHLARWLEGLGSVRDPAAAAVSGPRPLSPPATTATTARRRDAIDLGCGSNGTNVALLASHGYRAAGVDLVPEAIGRARRGAASWLAARDPPPPLPGAEARKDAASAEGRQHHHHHAAVAFAEVDLMMAGAAARLTSWEDVRRMEREQLGGLGRAEAAAAGGGETGAGGAGALRPSSSSSSSSSFSLLFDCQTFHVLRTTVADEAEVVLRYRSLLETGGVLLLLCGRPEAKDTAGRRQRADGPNEVSLGELRAAFCAAAGWREREIVATRFDPTPAYDRLPGGPPLAWAAVFEAV